MQDHADYTTNKKTPAYTTINCLYCIGLQFQSLMRHFRFGGTFSLVSKITINQSINQSGCIAVSADILFIRWYRKSEIKYVFYRL